MIRYRVFYEINPSSHYFDVEDESYEEALATVKWRVAGANDDDVDDIRIIEVREL